MDKKKYLTSIYIISFVLIADQCLKLWAKTHMALSEELNVMGDWLLLHLVENPAMRFPSDSGNILITLARLLIIIGLFLILKRQLQLNRKPFVIVILSLYVAGLTSNLFDSMFYGVVFDYAPLLQGKVVDVIFIVPFKVVINIADIAIMTGQVGVITMLVMWSKFFKKSTEPISEKKIN